MSFVIRPGATIGGHDAAQIQVALKIYKKGHLASYVTGVIPRSELFETMVMAGLIDRESHAITSSGHGLLRARFGARMSLQTAEAGLSHILDNLDALTASGAFKCEQAFLFGSVGRGAPSPGDVDLSLVDPGSDGLMAVHHLNRLLGDLGRDFPADIRISEKDLPWTERWLVWDRGHRPAVREMLAADEAARALVLHGMHETEAPFLDDPDDLLICHEDFHFSGNGPGTI